MAHDRPAEAADAADAAEVSAAFAGIDLDVTAATRALYTSDASLYRVAPLGVVHARHVDDICAVHEAAGSVGVPITMRGAGTSIAGNAVGAGIVIDTRGLARVLEIDPEARTARVEPGVVHADLQRAAAPHRLRFGPDPSTHTRCTIGGMIGNNACGSRALGYGRTADNVESLRVLFGNGELAHLGPGVPLAGTAQRLAGIGEENLAHLRTEFGRFGRQVSGYSLEHLLPERLRLDRVLVGSEGTLATVLEATVRLVDDDVVRTLLVLGYGSMAEAADAVPALLAAAPGRLIACEGMDARIVDLVRAKGAAVPELPRGSGWLFVEVAGDDAADLVTTLVAAGSPWAGGRSTTRGRAQLCGGSARTAPASPDGHCRHRPTAVGRTPPYRPRDSVRGCGTSRRSWSTSGSRASPTATSATAACTAASTSRATPATPRRPASSASS